MPPELLTEGNLSKAADVFAFGVLLWEMATGSRAWAGMSHTQVAPADDSLVTPRSLSLLSIVPRSTSPLTSFRSQQCALACAFFSSSTARLDFLCVSALCTMCTGRLAAFVSSTSLLV